MEVFKICREKYSKTLIASGASNRWNKKDEYVIYTGSTRALSTLELIVHRAGINLANPYKLLTIAIDDKALINDIDIKSLPDNWRTIEAYIDLQEIGSKWYKSFDSLVLKVPSAIIEQEYNYVINTKHPDFSKFVRLSGMDDFIWDKRLIQ